MTASRKARAYIGCLALLALGCAGRTLERGEADTNTNWLERCEEGDLHCSPLMTDIEPVPAETRAGAAMTPGEPTRQLPRGDMNELGTTDDCVVTCDAVLSGAECGEQLALPNFDQTLNRWQGRGCAEGALLEGHCAGGTLFVWRGAPANEMRYFDAQGDFIGATSFSSAPDPSTCNGVRRWPRQVSCDMPSITHEHCAGLELPAGDGAFGSAEFGEWVLPLR